MRKLLVLRGGALGDFIVTLPALAALRQHWPHARIELAGNATAAGLARARGLLDSCHSQHEARWSTLYGAAPLAPDFATWLGTFDLVVSYWPDPDEGLRKRFPLRADQVFVSAPALPQRGPAAAHYADALRPLGVPHPPPHFMLRPLAGSGTVSATGPRDVTSTKEASGITIHPGSGSLRKNWPAERWQALMAQLPRPLSVILGEAEMARRDPFPVADATVLVSRPLEDLVNHFAACRLFLGHDSGISHLAAACGVPSVLLFGPTEPALWAPPAPHVRVLRAGPDPAAIAVSEVHAAACAILEGRR